jgi:hypothetical protein
VHRRLHVTYGDGSTSGASALARDEHGIWRTTFALTLA